MNAMRIAVVSSMPPNPEGEAHYAVSVYSALAAQVSAHICAFAHVQPDAPDVSVLTPHFTVERVTYGYHRFKRHLALVHLMRAFQRFKPDLIHFQAPHKKYYGGVGGEPLIWLFRYLRRRQYPFVISLHSLWRHEDYAMLAAERGWSAHTRAALERLYRYYLINALATATQVNAVIAGEDNPLLQEVAQEWNLPQERLVAETHPCTPHAFHPSDIPHAKERLGIDPNTRLVFSFGFVRPDKGFHYLIEAVAPLVHRNPRLMAIVAGEPSGRAGKQYARQLTDLHFALGSPPQIRLELSYITDSQMHAYLRACDLLVIPYTRVMGPSGPLHHALSYGKPVVATSVGQNRGLSEVCWLVPPAAPEALREAVQQLLENPDCWADYHTRALCYAHSHTWELLAQRYYRDYTRITRGG